MTEPISDAEMTQSIADGIDPEEGLTIVAAFTIPGEPMSKARPRFTKQGRTYTPAKTKTAEEMVRAAYLAVARRIETNVDAAFRVEAEFHSGTRQRRDVDNMLKLILDGLNKTAWPDDVQVLEVSGRKGFVPKAEARTEVTIFRIAGGMNRPTQPCIRCGKGILTYESWKTVRRYCSTDCAYADRRDRKGRTCRQCGQEFMSTKPGRENAFCSRECSNESGHIEIPCATCGEPFWSVKSWVKDRPCCSDVCQQERDRQLHAERRSKSLPGSCSDCGAGTTRKEYTRCRPCSAAHRRKSKQ